MRISYRGIEMLLCGLACMTAAPAIAQTYPAKLVRIIVPYTPGGTTDVLARLIGQKLSQAWGQPVIVDNRPGANGIVGTDLVAKAFKYGYEGEYNC